MFHRRASLKSAVRSVKLRVEAEAEHFSLVLIVPIKGRRVLTNKSSYLNNKIHNVPKMIHQKAQLSLILPLRLRSG